MKQLLIVDDDPGMRMLLKEFLETCGDYQCVLAESGSSALVHLRTTNLDLMLLDVTIDGDSGQDFLRRVHQRFPKLPVIIVTAEGSIEDAVDCLKLGAEDYLTKPLDFTRLTRVLEQCLHNEEQQAKQPATAVPERTAILSTFGRRIGDYQVLRTIGEGGSGTVYLVKDAEEQEYAMKVLRCLADWNEEEARNALERFLREAETMADLQHPNIVHIQDFGVTLVDQIPYILMEYLEGTSLRKLMNGNRMDYRQKSLILRQMVEALAFIHDKGIVHRDVKPQNFIVSESGRVTMLDFGIVKIAEPSLTNTGTLVGTPNYTAPEYFRYGFIDARGDIFSLGIIAYELYLGQLPFSLGDTRHIQRAIVHEKPPHPQKLQPGFPIILQNMLAGMLKKDPAERLALEDGLALLDTYLGRRSAKSSNLRAVLQFLPHVTQSDWT